jgi:predicted small secreted protein
MRRIRLALVAVLALVALAACHTVEGVGKDIKSAGTAIEGAGNNR